MNRSGRLRTRPEVPFLRPSPCRPGSLKDQQERPRYWARLLSLHRMPCLSPQPAAPRPGLGQKAPRPFQQASKRASRAPAPRPTTRLHHPRSRVRARCEVRRPRRHRRRLYGKQLRSGCWSTTPIERAGGKDGHGKISVAHEAGHLELVGVGTGRRRGRGVVLTAVSGASAIDPSCSPDRALLSRGHSSSVEVWFVTVSGGTVKVSVPAVDPFGTV